MNVYQFGQFVRERVTAFTIRKAIAELKNPPQWAGTMRSPFEPFEVVGKELVELSEWYNSLDETDQVRLEEVIRLVVQDCVMRYSCLVDNAITFEDQDADLSFELYAVDENERVRLTGSIHDNV